jgi:hypothetical protein
MVNNHLEALTEPRPVSLAIGDRIYAGQTTERHKKKGVLFRPSESDRRWLYAYAEENERTVNDVLCEALTMYRKVHSKNGNQN